MTEFDPYILTPKEKDPKTELPVNSTGSKVNQINGVTTQNFKGKIKEKEIVEDDTFEQEQIFIESRDVTDFMIFFVSGNKKIEEPIVTLDGSYATKVEPVFALGSPTFVAAESGPSIFAGKIILNVLDSEVPLSNLRRALDGVDEIDEIPLVDLYIIPKNEEVFKKSETSAVIKGIKFQSFSISNGVENPGKYFVINFIAQKYFPIKKKVT